MPSAAFLIKPSSSLCNMRCKYCFYADVADNRAVKSFGMMNDKTVKKLIERAVQFVDEGNCSFLFQGGEPTLAGIDFYKKFIEEEKNYSDKKIKFSHSIQTNGYLIDEQWAEFLSQNNFLVGLSLDGNKDLQNINRVDEKGNGTFAKVTNAARLFKKHNVQFNVLSVVTSKGAKSVVSTYNFFKKNGFDYMQFIPCIDPFGKESQEVYSLSEREYATYLCDIFKMWNDDMRHGVYRSVRHIDNLMQILRGGAAEICSMSGHCSVQFVTEGDGSVYPCDFYVLDEWKMGNIFDNSFNDMLNGEVAKKFITESYNVNERCKACSVYRLCRGGCRRDRKMMPDGSLGLNRYCDALYEYYSFVLHKMT